MTTKAIMEKFGIVKDKRGSSVPGGEYTDEEFDILMVYATRVSRRGRNGMRYYRQYRRRKSSGRTQ